MLGKKNKHHADKFLILYLAFSVVNQVYSYFESYDFIQHSTWMLLGKGVFLLSGPFFFYYVYALTTAKSLSTKGYILTLLPFLSYFFHFLYFYWIGFNGKELEAKNGLLYVNGELSITWTFFIVLFLLTDPFYLIWFYWLLKKYKTRVMQSLSNTDRINLNWLSTLFYIWAAIALILFPVAVLSLGRSWISHSWVDLILQISYVVFIFILGYYGFRQTTVFSDLEIYAQSDKSENKNVSYERSGLSQEQASAYHQQLLVIMKEKKPYLDGELTAQNLSEALGISANYLSQILNKEQKQNFFDFINHYRVEEVKDRMMNPNYKNLTLLAIALDSGFNSKTSFNTIFKKITGKTPSQHYKSLPR